MTAIESHSAPLECPVCTLLSPTGTLRCDCGYTFTGGVAPQQGPLDEETKSVIGRWLVRRTALSNFLGVVWAWFIFFSLDQPIRTTRIVVLIMLLTLPVGDLFSWYSWRYHPERLIRRLRPWLRPSRQTCLTVLSVVNLVMLCGGGIFIARRSHGDHAWLALDTIAAVALIGLSILIDKQDSRLREIWRESTGT
jgi:hypothetical protein